MADENQSSNGNTGQKASSSSPPNASDSDTPNTVASAEKLLQEAEDAIASADQDNATQTTPFRLEELVGEGEPPEKCSIDLLNDVNLDLKIELGRTKMQLEEILKLRRGSVVTLDKLAGDPVDIFVNGRHVARGEVLVLNDNFCVRIAELLGTD
jgi:flagellar motor switch protein FliN/FliY